MFVSQFFSLVIYGCTFFNCGGIESYNAKCASWLNMYECHYKNYGDIHTDNYKLALKLGRNVKYRNNNHVTNKK